MLLAIYAIEKGCPLPDEITPLELHIPIFCDLIISEGNENTLLPLPNSLFGAQSSNGETTLGGRDVLNRRANPIPIQHILSARSAFKMRLL